MYVGTIVLYKREGISSKNDNVYIRHGVGLEWSPQDYVYYGQYHNNSREGLGVVKKNNMEVYVGNWSRGVPHGYGKIIGASGEVYQSGVFKEGMCMQEGKFS